MFFHQFTVIRHHFLHLHNNSLAGDQKISNNQLDKLINENNPVHSRHLAVFCAFSIIWSCTDFCQEFIIHFFACSLDELSVPAQNFAVCSTNIIFIIKNHYINHSNDFFSLVSKYCQLHQSVFCPVHEYSFALCPTYVTNTLADV